MQEFAYLIVPFIIAVVFTPIVKLVAKHLGVYALMNERTIHTKVMTRIGGVAIYLAFILSMTYFCDAIDSTIKGLLYGSSIMFLTGLIDDMTNMKPIIKLFFQLVATFVLISIGGVELDVIRLPLGITIDMGVISLLVTVGWVIGITNAINLIDGLDGLAGGVCAIILITIAFISFIDQRNDLAMLSLIMAGAILGFLVFNIHPASVMMGDCGALFIGFFIASISLMGFKSSTFITLGFPILLLSVPIIDTLSAILRRKLSGKSFADADKMHFHHMLMQRFGHRNSVFIIYLITIAFGISAYLYIINKTLGLLLVCILFIAIEIFIEKTEMISRHYHPILGVCRRVKKMFGFKR